MPETFVKSILSSMRYTRLDTMHLRYPRAIHAELMTHRVFSRNARSSRAVPTKKLIEEILKDPWIPEVWEENIPGMQGGAPLSKLEVDDAIVIWIDAARNSARSATLLSQKKVHKQLANRLLEPFMMIDTLLSTTEIDNFFDLRLDLHAEPHMRILAFKMKELYETTVPQYLGPDEWHLPYISEEDRKECINHYQLKMASAMRCARISYKPFEGTSTIHQDVVKANELASKKHWSPFEHVAVPRQGKYGNFFGFKQLRQELEHVRT